MVLFVISLNDPLVKILPSFSLAMFLSDLEFLASKAGMLSRGHQIMVPIDLDAEAVC